MRFCKDEPVAPVTRPLDQPLHTAAMAVALLLAPPLTACYTPPGLLEGPVAPKRRAVERRRRMPEAREDGSWALRLGYPTSDTSFALTRAIGWKRERPAVLADLKRMSPGAKLGQTDVVCEVLDAAIAIDDAIDANLAGALVAIDRTSYGGSAEDLIAARRRADEAARKGLPTLPLVAKDLVIDPLQVCTHAHAHDTCT